MQLEVGDIQVRKFKNSLRKTDTHRRVPFSSPMMLHAICLRKLCLPNSSCHSKVLNVRNTYKFCDSPRFSSHYSSSSISPSSLPECTAGSSFAEAGGVLVLCRRSRGGTGERSRSSISLLVLCVISQVRIYFYLVAKCIA